MVASDEAPTFDREHRRLVVYRPVRTDLCGYFILRVTNLCLDVTG